MAFSDSTKEEIFQRAKGLCERCGKQLVFQNHLEGQRGAWEAHHKTSVKAGGRDVASNGEALCLACHKRTRTYGQ